MTTANMDPNWFYSSLAQCAATLVGLLGAVVVTRMQQQLADVRASALDLHNRLNLFRHELHSLAHAVEQFSPAADAVIAEMRSALASGRSRIDLQYEPQLWGGGTGPSTVAVTRENLDRWETQRAAVGRILDALRGEFVQSGDLRPVCARLERLCREMPAWVVAPVEGRRHTASFNMDQLSLHESRASVRGPVVVTALLLWLCLIGLIWPLAFLSAYSATSKVALLAGFGAGVLAVPLYIATQIVEIYSLRNVTLP